MEQHNITGKLIEYVRTEANISRGELCRGLCSRAFLARVEKGERACERILSEALLQRAGVASDRFVFTADPEEQIWLMRREEMYRAVDRGDGKKADTAFEEYRKIARGKSPLHRQLLLFYRAVLDWKSGEERETSAAMLAEAWEISQPGISMREMNCGNLTMTELGIAMMHARVTEDMGALEAAEAAYEILLQHLDMFADDRDSVRLYPQIAYRLAQICLKRDRAEKAVALAEKSITLLKGQAKLHYLRQHLEILLQYGTLKPEEQNAVTEICSSLRWLYEHHEVEESHWNWDISFSMAEYNLCGEILRARRETLGMSQEELAEGICDPVTVSRIECGRSAPKRKTFVGLMQKVGLTGSEHETDMPMNQPELWKLETEIHRLLNQARGEEAEPLIALLEQRLHEPNRQDKQFIIHTKALALANQKKISLEQERDMCREALYLTLPHKATDELKKWYFTMAEVACVNSLAHTEDRLGNRGEYIDLLNIIKRQYEEKFLGLQHYARGYELTCRTLGDLLGNAGRYEEGIKVENAGIKIALECGLGAILISTLYDCGWNMEHLWESGGTAREESLRYMRASYYLEALLGREKDKEFIKKHIEEIYTKCH